MAAAKVRGSPFLDPGPTATTDSLAVLHLKRDLLMPVKLADTDHDNEGYDEGRVTNTRFGSFPHSTLIGLPWGSQIRASDVDTGSRGRRGLTGPHSGKKRKRGQPQSETVSEDTETASKAQLPKAPVVAATGFVHLLAPTPESWTASLPHRTQVVYTPDYSYVLHRLRARPGTHMIEAGAGSGSFTHAAARAVYNGYPDNEATQPKKSIKSSSRFGKVWSFEFHEQRVERLRSEIKDHGLDEIVNVSHRDVYRDGFLLDVPSSDSEKQSPNADAIFLDLPAPWLALPHLSRKPPTNTHRLPNNPPTTPSVSPLNPHTTARLCTFSPCIEQVQTTVTTLRQLGWVDIDVVEISHRRIEVRRERTGLHEEGKGRGVHAAAATVEEALGKLRMVERRMQMFHGNEDGPGGKAVGDGRDTVEGGGAGGKERKLFKEGRLVHRAESDVKTHTSYLVFALLPREWTAEDEEAARRKWCGLGKSESTDVVGDGAEKADGDEVSLEKNGPDKQ
ncbi:MAG: tRNA (adenine-N(1)-)-methyltransferase catalytic subunit trm61 [Piccolia ochrophora]|nr:MAG: tRNA (adenine-N(1)-)-methyltransferase catalytic subunit trm61 [Piccolia ochrophora]